MRRDALDVAVTAAYGWLAGISDDYVPREWPALNGGGQEPTAIRYGSRTARTVLGIPVRKVVTDGGIRANMFSVTHLP